MTNKFYSNVVSLYINVFQVGRQIAFPRIMLNNTTINDTLSINQHQ